MTTETPSPPDLAQPDTSPDLGEYRARQRSRNRALGAVLVFLVVLFYAITLVRIGANAG